MVFSDALANTYTEKDEPLCTKHLYGHVSSPAPSLGWARCKQISNGSTEYSAAAMHCTALPSTGAAGLTIGAEVHTLGSLEHRRRIGALAHLYKLQSWGAPEKLRQMIPSKLERPPRGRTRASAREHDSWHETKFQPVPAGIGPDYIARGFPFCIIKDWNRLPANFFTDGFDIAHLQSFKGKVNNFLRSQPNPLRGEAA